ncbi:MAG: hypothetical protein H7840_17635 [Alphaproteobacteria bacterium]
MASDRSVSIGGYVTDSVIVTGDNASVAKGTGAASSGAPTPNAEILEALAALRPLLTSVRSTDDAKIDSALRDAEHEMSKSDPSPDEVGSALERALKYARTGVAFVEMAGKIVPQVAAAVTWLGEGWVKLSDMVESGG